MINRPILLKTFEKFTEEKQDRFSSVGYLYIYTDKKGVKYICTQEMYLRLKTKY